MNREAWGWHTLVDALCDKDKVCFGNEDRIAAFTKDLVKSIDMQAFGEPVIPHFATHDPEKGGYSLNQFIETSNICAHFVDSTGEVYLDVNSCKEYDPDVIGEVLVKWFGGRVVRKTVLRREALTD